MGLGSGGWVCHVAMIAQSGAGGESGYRSGSDKQTAPKASLSGLLGLGNFARVTWCWPEGTDAWMLAGVPNRSKAETNL